MGSRLGVVAPKYGKLSIKGGQMSFLGWGTAG